MAAKLKETTSVCRVFERLCQLDDFRTARQLQSELALDSTHVSSALHHLRQHKAVECLADAGQLWWYATPATDTRLRHHDERCPETKPRRSRKGCRVDYERSV